MDTIKCKALLKVLETGSLSETADALGYTPSGISRMISSMESETGFPLIHRSRSGITATNECQKLLPTIKRLAHLGEDYRKISNEILGIHIGSITVGTAYTAFYPWLSRLIFTFSEIYPGITINIVESTSSELSQALNSRTIDFCIISEREGDHQWLPLIEDELLVLLPPSHPYAHEDRFPIDLFSTEPFIEIYPGQETDNSRVFKEYSIHPNIRYSTIDSFAACSMVEAGLGITMANALVSKLLHNKTVILPIDPPQTISIGIAVPHPYQQSPVLKKFINFAKERLNDLIFD